jgi:hypothetical protein
MRSARGYIVSKGERCSREADRNACPTEFSPVGQAFLSAKPMPSELA